METTPNLDWVALIRQGAVSTYPLITQELLNRGWTAENIHKLMSGNILRVMRAAERVAAEMQSK